MDLIIDNIVITTPIYTILKSLKQILRNGKLKDIEDLGSEIRVTCPFHDEGKENTPDCYIVVDSKKFAAGTFHCFACHASGTFDKFVAGCLDSSIDVAKRWLIDNFGELVDDYDPEKIKFDDDIVVDTSNNYLDETTLSTFQSYHPYMTKRKLSKDICEKFQVKYDTKSECIVFPVRDVCGNLMFVTRRSVNNKKFMIPPGVTKPVYLLNEVVSRNIREVIVCESQINALTCWTYGVPAIALFGTGANHQYDILNDTDIIHYILAFDGDDAGKNGAKKFEKNINQNVFVDVVELPTGKDINDLSREEFNNIFKDFIYNQYNL